MLWQAMNDELKRQEKVLDNVTDHTERTGADLYAVSTQAKRDFKVRPKRTYTFSTPVQVALFFINIQFNASVQESHIQYVLCL